MDSKNSSNHFQLSRFVTRFVKTCIVHTSNFSILVTPKIYLDLYIDVNVSGNVILPFIYYFEVINMDSLWFYGSLNSKNWMCELCTFSQIQLRLNISVRFFSQIFYFGDMDSLWFLWISQQQKL